MCIRRKCAESHPMRTRLYLRGALEGVPVDGERVVADLLDVADDADGVLGVGVEDALLDRVLPRVPELPQLDLLLGRLVVPERHHDHSLDSRILQRRHFGVGHVFCRDKEEEISIDCNRPVGKEGRDKIKVCFRPTEPKLHQPHLTNQLTDR